MHAALQVFDFPTAAAIADYVATKLPAAAEAVSEVSEDAEVEPWEVNINAQSAIFRPPAGLALAAGASSIALGVTAFSCR